MTAPVTLTQLQNAATDCDHIAAIATSTSTTATDRLGNTKKTLQGALLALGWQVPVAYTSGLSMTAGSQTVSYNGELYAPKIADLPFTTSGTFETAKFYVVPGGSIRSDLAETDGSDLVGFTQSGTGAIARTVQDELRERVTVTQFGAIADNGVTDNYSAFVAALAVSDHVIVPDNGNGDTYGIGDGTITLGNNQTLEFTGHAKLARYSALSSSTDPVVWLYGNRAQIVGGGTAGRITSQNRTPEGVVLIGQETMATTGKNVLRCAIRNIAISGYKEQGDTSGDLSHVIKINAPQISNSAASYFHHIHNVHVLNGNYGISLNGWANANFISDIYGEEIGGAAADGSLGAMIHMNGCLENNIHNIFHHDSGAALTILVDVLDNTGVGGRTHTPAYNDVSGIISEQGGLSRCLYINDCGGNNTFRVKRNTNFGNVVPSYFYSSGNLLISDENINGFGVYMEELKAKHIANYDQEKTERQWTNTTYLTGLAENTTYAVATLEVTSGNSAFVEVDYVCKGASGLNYQGAGRAVYSVKNISGTITATAQLARFDAGIKPCQMQVSGTTVTLPFRVNNNGTAVATFTLVATVRVMGYAEPTINTTAVTASSGTVLTSPT